MRIKDMHAPRTCLALIRAVTLATFVVTSPALPSRVLGAATLYVVGACILGALRPKLKATDVILLAVTVAADIVWCTAAFIYFGPLDSLPAVIYASAMAAFAAAVSPAASVAIGVGSAAAYCACAVLLSDNIPAWSVQAQLVAFQAVTMVLAGILSGCIAAQYDRLRRTRAMVDRLERLNLATVDTTVTRSDEAVKAAAVRHALETVEAKRAWIMRLDDTQDALVIGSQAGLEANDMDEEPQPTYAGLAGHVMSTGEPANSSSPGAPALSALEKSRTLDALIGIPLPGPGGIHGVLMVTGSANGDGFSKEDEAVLTLLGRAVGGALQTAGLIRDLHHSSTTDSLTGLYNHGAFFDLLAARVRSARKTGHELCLVLLDLDRFKEVNDTAGHWQGDRLLKALGDTLRHSFRDMDVISRCGGDEFAVLLEETPPSMAVEIANRTTQAIAEAAKDIGLDVPVSASWGIACFPADATTDEGLFKEADTRLYIAKQEGGCRAVYQSDRGAVDLPASA